MAAGGRLFHTFLPSTALISATQAEERTGSPGVFFGGEGHYYGGYLIISLHLGVLARGELHCIAVHCTLYIRE